MEPQYDNRDFEGQMVETQKNVRTGGPLVPRESLV